MIQLEDQAPNFTAETTKGPINFHEYINNSWAVLFSHPKDFTPVCTTELGYLAKVKPEFDKRNVKIIAVSIDSVADHRRWSNDIEAHTNTTLNYPIIGDENRVVARLYGMIHENASDTLTVRSIFVIGPDKKVKLMIIYPSSAGRNFDELLRVIDSLQLTAEQKLATPVNWKKGEPCIIAPSLSDEDAHRQFSDINTADLPSGKTYLRYTPDPSLTNA